jgi:hypothetical protein
MNAMMEARSATVMAVLSVEEIWRQNPEGGTLFEVNTSSSLLLKDMINT